ncbi:MAG: hypothetical protein ACREL3_14200 [Gemmatimonadales bacterium]
MPVRRSSHRGNLIWLCIALTFVPAVVIRMIPGGWYELHPVAKWVTIGMGAACTLAVCYLVLTSKSDGG